MVMNISSGLYEFRRIQLMEHVLIRQVRDQNYCKSDWFPVLMYPRLLARGWYQYQSDLDFWHNLLLTRRQIVVINSLSSFLFLLLH
jgi:hypothetical protein